MLSGVNFERQDVGVTCCDGLMELNVSGQDGGSNGCDGLLDVIV